MVEETYAYVLAEHTYARRVAHLVQTLTSENGT
jgi:hypothetical protein